MFPRRQAIHALLLPALLTLAAALPLSAQTPLNPHTAASALDTLSFSWDNTGSPFIIAVSTDPQFLVQAATGSLAANTTAYINLSQNTTYYFRVKRASESDSAYAINGVSTATWAAAPAGIFSVPAFFTANSPNSATASIGWSVSGNPEWTVYEVSYADNSSFTGETLRPYINPQGAPLDISGLAANTTYYFRVRARGVAGTVTGYTSPVSTATLAVIPGSLSAEIYESSVAVAWTPVNGATQAEQSEGYRLIVSTSETMTPLIVDWPTSDMNVSSHLLTSLNRNTSYYYKLGSLNQSGSPSWYHDAAISDTRFLATLASRPQHLARLAMTDVTATLGWTALPTYPQDATALGYRLDASTSAAFSGTVLSSASYGAVQSTLTVNSLDPNTTYYFRAGSLNTDFSPNYTAQQSSITLALALSAHPSLTRIYPGAQDITITYIPWEVSPQAFSCEGYKIEATTGVFGGTAPVFSSVTYDNQAGMLTVPGLAPNNVYQLRIASLNWEHTPNYTLLPSTRTGIPGYLTGVTLASVWSSSAVVTFTPGIAAEAHVAQASPDKFFEGTVISAVGSPAATTLSILGLDANTTYYYRVGALYNGATIYTNTSPDMRQTLPVTVGGMGVSSVFYSSVTVSWTPLPGTPQTLGADSYVLQTATDSAFGNVLFSSRSYVLSAAALTIGGLSPNTTYYFRNGAVNEQGYANYTAAHSTATLANPPVPKAFSLTPDSITLNWLTSSNPPDTRYLVEMSDDPTYASAQPSSTTVLSSATFSGLLPNTTYYSRVTAINRLGRAAPSVDFSPMATGAYDPAPAAASGMGVTGLTANWGASLNTPLITSYEASISSNPDFSGTVLSSVTKNLSASFDGLVSNASYYLRVSALNLSGVPTWPPVSLGTALTLPATAYILPEDQVFTSMLIDGFTVNWADNGNSSFTVYQVEASTMPDFSVINSSLSVRALSCAFSGLGIDEQYYVRLRAQGQAGALSGYEQAGSTRTLLSSQIGAGAQQDNLATLETSYGTITVLLPSGSIGGYTRLTIMPSTMTLPGPLSAVSDLTPTGIGLVITYFPPTLILDRITITLPYRVADLPPAMQADRSKLILALYDEVHGIWVPLPSVSDTANNRVIAQTWHLSTFQIMQAQPQAALNAVKVYPNPYRPNSVSDVMHFTNMPPLARVKIYTFAGELVREIKADVNGMAAWDGLNDAGRKVASGVYIAYIQTKDKKSGRSIKIAIER